MPVMYTEDELKPWSHACVNCERYFQGECLFSAPPQKTPSLSWGCHHHIFSWHTVYHTTQQLNKVTERLKKAQKELRRLRCRIKKLESSPPTPIIPLSKGS
jgi:hypothetical protein